MLVSLWGTKYKMRKQYSPPQINVCKFVCVCIYVCVCVCVHVCISQPVICGTDDKDLANNFLHPSISLDTICFYPTVQPKRNAPTKFSCNQFGMKFWPNLHVNWLQLNLQIGFN